MNRYYRTLLVSAGLVLGIAACQEQLTAPGSCPATCPGGTPVIHDTVIDAILDGDSTYSGYLNRGSAPAGLRVANGLNGSTDYAVVKFDRRPDSLLARDTIGGPDSMHSYTIDSVAIELTVLARDTLATGVMIEVHRIPVAVDTSVAFGDIDPLIVPGTLIDSVTIADSIKPGKRYRFVFQGDTLSSVAIPAADSGVLALAISISGPSTTGLRIGSVSSGTSLPLFTTYVTMNITDTTTSNRHQLIPRSPEFTSYVSSVPSGSDPDILYVGTSSISRAFIRFPWPPYLRDSALLARATLELTPAAPLTGLPGDSVFLVANGVRVDFGPKSPASNTLGGVGDLILGSSDTIRVDVIHEVVLWQPKATSLPHPPIFVMSMTLEGASFTEPSFRSTRSGGGAPRLRVTYQLPFDFERP